MRTNKKTLRKALSFRLSSPSKMPGFSFALPAARCNNGSKLRKIPGSVCRSCYAHKGCYAKYKRVARVRNDNYSIVSRTKSLSSWARELSTFINATNQAAFRFHDSGDLVSFEYLCAIVGVVRNSPNCKFWLPTKEYALVDRFIKSFGSFPGNLCVRVSSPMVGQGPLFKYGCTSTVDSNSGFNCPVTDGKDNCNKHNCRACWNNNVANVNYHKH